MKATPARKPRAALPLTDGELLDYLAGTGGHMRGQADGMPAFRIFGSNDWHPDLRSAIEAHAVASRRPKNDDE